MPRTRTRARESLVENAMHHFWVHGYRGTSVSDLVAATGVGQAAIYSDFKDKHGLFLACLDHYTVFAIDDPFSHVEAPSARLADIEQFIQSQLGGLISLGLPARGCLMGNSASELSAHDDDVRVKTRGHYERLAKGFEMATANEVGWHDDLKSIGRFFAIAFQGLLAFARGCEDGNMLREQGFILTQTMRATIEPYRNPIAR